ncbi:MAG: GNAT family N-acetyltransferase [Chitinophagaceae bacterium]
MAKHWDALVYGDYEAVMPLTWNSKWGISYLYQPAFMQQLGVFSKAFLDTSLLDEFISTARKHFRFAEIFLNYHNNLPGLPISSNMILSLDKPYEEVYNGYARGFISSLDKSGKHQLMYRKDADINNALTNNRLLYGMRVPHVTDECYERFNSLCKHAYENDSLVLRTATDDQGQVVATALLFSKNGRLYLLQSTTPEEGRVLAANHFLLDRIIHEFAGKQIILDLEGSDIPGVAHFYKSLGATGQPYFFCRWNDLPWFLKWMKS